MCLSVRAACVIPPSNSRKNKSSGIGSSSDNHNSNNLSAFSLHCGRGVVGGGGGRHKTKRIVKILNVFQKCIFTLFPMAF